MALTTQETAELAKIVSGVRLLSSALGKVANLIKTDTIGFPDTKRRDYNDIIYYTCGSSLYYELTLASLLQTYIDFASDKARLVYPKNIDDAKANFATAGNLIIEGLNRLKNYPELASALSDAQKAQSLFASFDWTLAYASPYPDSYPRVIGPHGDYDSTQAQIIQVRKYLAESSILGVYSPQTAKVWPVAANPDYAMQVQSTADVIDRQIRVLSLNAGIEMPDDAALITQDFNAGSGLRPREFFRVLVGVEIAMNGIDSTPHFSGRSLQQGISLALLHNLTAVSFVLGKLDRTDPAIVDFVWKQGIPGGYFSDFGIAWRALDTWATQDLLFFHQIPLPPVPVGDGGHIDVPQTTPPPSGTTTIPAGYFDPQVAKLDRIIALSDAKEVKDALRAKEGKPI